MAVPATIRIGTRGSPLAVAQTEAVAAGLESAWPGLKVQIVPFTTRGDRWSGPLTGVGGKGLFTAELEAALRRGDVQLAVHSSKDLPAELSADLVLASAPAREDPRDALVSRHGGGVADLPPGATVGTSSLRRAAQLRAIRADLRVVAMRGNVQTRLAQVLEAPSVGLDATVLAMAGLKRLRLMGALAGRIQPLAADQFIPAAGQGILAIQCRAGDPAGRALAEKVGHGPSMQALRAERRVVAGLGADCRSCLGVHVAPAGGGWRAWGLAARPDGSGAIRQTADAPQAALAADLLLLELLRSGARQVLASA